MKPKGDFLIKQRYGNSSETHPNEHNLKKIFHGEKEFK